MSLLTENSVLGDRLTAEFPNDIVLEKLPNYNTVIGKMLKSPSKLDNCHGNDDNKRHFAG